MSADPPRGRFRESVRTRVEAHPQAVFPAAVVVVVAEVVV
ncbi:MAG: hypothetical protein RLY70_2753, partial [Planctomycetota bacterium]